MPTMISSPTCSCLRGECGFSSAGLKSHDHHLCSTSDTISLSSTWTHFAFYATRLLEKTPRHNFPNDITAHKLLPPRNPAPAFLVKVIPPLLASASTWLLPPPSQCQLQRGLSQGPKMVTLSVLPVILNVTQLRIANFWDFPGDPNKRKNKNNSFLPHLFGGKVKMGIM